jgi:DNA processing protein
MKKYTRPAHPLAPWLALWRIPGIGPVGFSKLLKRFPNLDELFHCSPAQLIACGFPSSLHERLHTVDWKSVHEDLAWHAQDGHHIITCQDTAYPGYLHEIPARPPLLYVKGALSALARPHLALVGSRNPSPAGRETAYQFAKALSKMGICICSGLALGIDAASHRGALCGRGGTLAILGSGIDRLYPSKHRTLAKEISTKGALISEFSPNTPPAPHHFPRRNRIISGISMGVVVIEASLKSGSLITARYAIEQGRELFAIPGSIHNPLAKGCHSLIRQGAKLVDNLEHIVEELPIKQKISPTTSIACNEPQLAKEQQNLVKCIGYEITSLDVMVERSGFSTKKVASILAKLEMAGYIEAVPGGYMRIH